MHVLYPQPTLKTSSSLQLHSWNGTGMAGPLLCGARSVLMRYTHASTQCMRIICPTLCPPHVPRRGTNPGRSARRELGPPAFDSARSARTAYRCSSGEARRRRRTRVTNPRKLGGWGDSTRIPCEYILYINIPGPSKRCLLIAP